MLSHTHTHSHTPLSQYFGEYILDGLKGREQRMPEKIGPRPWALAASLEWSLSVRGVKLALR